MYFGFSDEQRELAAAAAAVLDATSSPDAVRAAWDAPAGQLDRQLWTRLVDLGVPFVMVPEEDGGLGFDERALVLILERAGSVAAPVPIVESALVAPTLFGHDVAGSLVAADLGGSLVAYGADADLVMLSDHRGICLFARDQVQARPVAAVDGGRRLAEVDGRGDASAYVDVSAEVQLAHDRMVFGTSALLVGLAQRMLDLTVEYVTSREQFGVPIGSFQAVKHHCADALTAVSFARPAVYRAAWSLATGQPTVMRDVSMAKAMASDAGIRVAQLALQCHGAIGYTVEYDLHLYLKRAHALAAAHGNAAFHRARVAEAIGVNTPNRGRSS